MNAGPAFKPDAQTAELMQPRKRSFNHPAIHAQTTAVFSVAPRNPRLNAAFTQRVAMGLRVVAAVGVDLIRSPTRPTAFAPHRRNSIHHRQQLCDIVCVGTGQRNSEWNALRICDDVVFAARFGAIGRIWTGAFAPKTARTEALSMAERDQSIWSIAFNSANSTSCSFCHTPSCCHWFNRRQQVMPDPQPISWGRSSHAIPVFNTNRIPVSTLRLSSGHRPGFFARRGLTGMSGSINSHSASSTSGFAMPLA